MIDNPDRFEPPAHPRYPTTRHTLLDRLRDSDHDSRKAAYNILVAAYWRPVYKHLRRQWNKDRQNAEDITQEFFSSAYEKSFFDGYDASKARFRTFIRTCVDRFAGKEKRRQEAVKRGGGKIMLSLDFDAAENELGRANVATNDSPDTLFEKEWARSVFAIAIDRLKRETEAKNKSVAYEIFARFDLEAGDEPARPSYRDLAEQFKIKETDVTNYLAAMRRQLKRIILDLMRELTGSEEEFREEVRALFGGDNT
jgi:RNA polymerase sigma factor (sigma-70 family)